MSCEGQALNRIALEDPLTYLPRREIREYERGAHILHEEQASAGFHLVIRGSVKVAIPGPNGSSTVTDIAFPGEFFGKRGFLRLARHGERAVALEDSAVMSWTADELEQLIEREPRLGLALIQVVVARCIDLGERLQNQATDIASERIAQALLRTAQRIGVRRADGSVRIPPMTHQLIAEYVGTSRPIVTTQLINLRQLGLIRYSRKAILMDAERLAHYLRTQRGASGD